MRMTKIGYACMLEQFHPTDLLDWAEQAEAAGFSAGFQVSEHFHPWTPQQGQAAFAWSFMGALGQRTSLPFGTAVTCPGFRYHPAVIAHAAATLGAMYPGRVLAGPWGRRGAQRAHHRRRVAGGRHPELHDVRGDRGHHQALQRQGGEARRRVLHARVGAPLHGPEQPVPILVATAGPVNAKRTGKYADGIITVGAADEKIAMLWGKFREGATEAGKDSEAMTTQLQVHVSWAPTQQEAEDQALREWPNGGMPFPKQDIKNPEDFENMAKLVRIEHFANRMLISADLDEHLAALQGYVDMGFDSISPAQRGTQPGRVHRHLRREGAPPPQPVLGTDASASAGRGATPPDGGPHRAAGHRPGRWSPACRAGRVRLRWRGGAHHRRSQAEARPGPAAPSEHRRQPRGVAARR